MEQTFGESLRAIRKQKGLSQLQLATKAGLHFTYISKIERNLVPPPAAGTIVKLCNILEVPPEQLLVLARKTPAEFIKVLSSSRAALEFVRHAQSMGLSDDEWQRLTQELRKEKDFINGLVETVQAIILTIDKEGRILYFNPHMEEILGYRLEEIRGKDWFDTLLPERDRARIRKRFEQAINDIQMQGNVNLIVTKDGRERYIEWYDKTLKDVDGNTIGLIATGQDITERKQAEETLRQSEERYRTTLNSMLEGCQITDFDWRYVYLNDAAIRHSQNTREALLGHTMMEIYPGIENTEMFANLRRCMEKRIPHHMENLFTYPDGSQSWFELSIEPVPQGILVLSLDITERKRAEERIINLNSVLKALRSVNQLIVHQKDRELLIQRSCDLMVETRGFLCAWILLFDEKRKYVSATVTGGKETQAFYQQLKQGDYPPCIDRILAHKDSFAVCGDIVENGLDCLPRSYYRGGSGLISRLEYEGKVYGIVSVYIQSDYVLDPEEQSLFRELAGDIAFALYNIEKEEERKQSEEALRESEERYRTLFESAAEGILIADIEAKKFKYANPAICTMLGYSQEELTKMSVSDIHPKDSLEYVLAEFNAQARGEKELSTLPCLKKDGTIIYADINAAKAIIDGRECNIGFFTDITERKRAEENIVRSAQEWSATFDSITDLVSIHNKDFKLIRVNKAFANSLNMKPEELIGKTCYQVIHGTTEPVSNCPHMKTLKTKEPARGEFLEPHLGIHLEVATSPIFDDNGEVVASVHVARDITERKKMEEQLIVNDRLASIGQFASGIAHELNNPLTSVIGFSELLLEKDLAEDVKKDLTTINREAKRTANVVKGLLTFARKQKAEKESVDINSIIQGVLQLRSHEHRVSNIEINTRFAPDLPQIIGNGGQLQQVLINIIVNAEQVMLEAHGRGKLTVTTEQVGNMVRASFTDDGPGISPENMRKLFTPFFTTKEVGRGTGLGLSICHGIITEHNGRIYAESELGKGATFVVELPVSQ